MLKPFLMSIVQPFTSQSFLPHVCSFYPNDPIEVVVCQQLSITLSMTTLVCCEYKSQSNGGGGGAHATNA